MAKHDSAYDQVAAPSAGGTFRNGKDPANCDDALGQPSKYHGSQQEVKVQDGRAIAANEEQHTTGRRTGINSKTKDDFAKDSGVEDINPVERSVPIKRG